MDRRKAGKQGNCTARKGFRGRCKLLAGVACVSFLLHSVLLAAAEDSAVAAVMQLMKTEGEVSVSNGSGRDISLIKNMRLYNGYSASTQEESYAWINMDSEKLAKLDAVSEAEVRKSGKKLEILLDSGNLFFNVTEDLEEDETLNIRTSTMVMGIRGTCGWVRVIDRWHSQVYLLEGEVSCSVTDPVTGQVKSTVLKSGQTAEFVVYSEKQAGDKCDIIMRGFSGNEIPGFVLVELAEDGSLCEKIQEASGIDAGSYAANAQVRLAKDQEEMRQKLEVIRRLLAEQENYISKDPVWKRGNASPSSSPTGTPYPSPRGGSGSQGERGENSLGTGPSASSGSGAGAGSVGSSSVPAASGAMPTAAPGKNTGDGSNTESGSTESGQTPAPPADTSTAPSVPDTPAAPQEPVNSVTLPPTATVNDIIDAFNNGADQVVVDGDFRVYSSFEIPAGKTLTVTGDLGVNNSPDQPQTTLTVNGSLEVEGDLTNNGTIEIGTVDPTGSRPAPP